jgi:hypothetical protein
MRTGRPAGSWCCSTTRLSAATRSATAARNSGLGKGVQSAWWNTASSWTHDAAVRCEIARANVLFPDPEVPTTQLRRTDSLWLCCDW